jgi:hypothetical protein
MVTSLRPKLLSTGCIPSNQHSWRLQAHWKFWDIAIIKDIRLSTAIEVLHELFSDHLPVILDLEDEKGTPRAIIRIFTDLEKYADVLEITLPPCPSLPFTPAYRMMLLLFSKPH